MADGPEYLTADCGSRAFWRSGPLPLTLGRAAGKGMLPGGRTGSCSPFSGQLPTGMIHPREGKAGAAAGRRGEAGAVSTAVATWPEPAAEAILEQSAKRAFPRQRVLQGRL